MVAGCIREGALCFPGPYLVLHVSLSIFLKSTLSPNEGDQPLDVPRSKGFPLVLKLGQAVGKPELLVA